MFNRYKKQSIDSKAIYYSTFWTDYYSYNLNSHAVPKFGFNACGNKENIIYKHYLTFDKYLPSYILLKDTNLPVLFHDVMKKTD